MKILHHLPIRYLLTLVLVFHGLALSASAAVTAGFADRDITPEIGMEQPGGYGKSFHRSLHDPCKVRAVVVVDGEKSVAIVGIDALMVPRHLVLACRAAIEKKCGVPASSIMIAASHSHSSGPTGMVQPGQFDHASPLVQRLAYEQSSAADPKYLKLVEKQIIDAVCAAHASRAELLFGFGSGVEDQVAFNRRFRMRGGLTNTHPGQGNPDILGFAGPIDPEVGVVAAWDSKGKLVGCIVNYACHATTSPGGISANYIHYIEKTIRGVMGPDVVVVFTAGAAGDVTQVDNLSPYRRQASEQSAQFVGGRIGAEVIKVLFSIERTGDVAVDSRSKVLNIKRRAPSPQHLAEALKLVQNPPEKSDRLAMTFAKETVMLDALLAKHPLADVEVQAVQIGPAVFASNPAEYFCQYGLDIKKGSRFPLTFPVSLANGCVGYVPTEEALGPRGGGYETRLTSYSNLIPTAGTTIANECISLTRQLTPGAVPQRPPHPPFRGSGWGYGNLPPQLD